MYQKNTQIPITPSILYTDQDNQSQNILEKFKQRLQKEAVVQKNNDTKIKAKQENNNNLTDQIFNLKGNIFDSPLNLHTGKEQQHFSHMKTIYQEEYLQLSQKIDSQTQDNKDILQVASNTRKQQLKHMLQENKNQINSFKSSHASQNQQKNVKYNYKVVKQLQYQKFSAKLYKRKYTQLKNQYKVLNSDYLELQEKYEDIMQYQLILSQNSQFNNTNDFLLTEKFKKIMENLNVSKQFVKSSFNGNKITQIQQQNLEQQNKNVVPSPSNNTNNSPYALNENNNTVNKIVTPIVVLKQSDEVKDFVDNTIQQNTNVQQQVVDDALDESLHLSTFQQTIKLIGDNVKKHQNIQKLQISNYVCEQKKNAHQLQILDLLDKELEKL